MPKANSGTFSYPGGKTTIAPWIVERFADHEVYVEPFGGSASTFMHKEPSGLEVYNDLNEDCVTFFRVIKNQPEELREWIRTTPYSRKLFDEWSERFKNGERPEDEVEHAGRFWFIQTASFGGKLPDEGSSFSVAKKSVADASTNPIKWNRKGSQTEVLADRFRSVQIEYQDYRKVVERYDSPETLFYFDPPYVGAGDDYYQGEGFDHREFGEILSDIGGRWVVSYDEIPEWCETYYIESRSREWTIDSNRESEGTEKLVMNYDPDETRRFTCSEQASVKDY